MSVQPAHHYTPDEYLALERTANYKSEYLNGHIYAMAGSTANHALITINAAAAIWSAGTGGPSRVYSNDLRVHVSATGLYTYPDLTVVCDQNQSRDSGLPDSVLNPILLVEVLSDSTERYDRGTKFDHYRRIPSLQEYVLISLNSPKVESCLRQEGDSTWLLTIATGLDAEIDLKSIGITIRLADVFRQVIFPPLLRLSDDS